MTASRVQVENGSTLADYYVGTDSRTYGGGTTDIPTSILLDGTANTALSIIAEDAAIAGGEAGILAIGQRKDTRASTAGADGDATIMTFNAQGAQYVEASRKVVAVSGTPSGLTTATTTYTSGDVLGGVFSVASCARHNGGSGRIVGVYMTDDSDVIGAVDLFIYDTTVSPGSDNAAFNPSDADNELGLGVIQIPTAIDAGSNRASYWSGSVPFVCTGSSTTLYFVAVTRSANAVFGGGATSLTFRFLIEQD
jgi:hypothetical protein